VQQNFYNEPGVILELPFPSPPEMNLLGLAPFLPASRSCVSGMDDEGIVNVIFGTSVWQGKGECIRLQWSHANNSYRSSPLCLPPLSASPLLYSYSSTPVGWITCSMLTLGEGHQQAG
jgi:hypothetical protein